MVRSLTRDIELLSDVGIRNACIVQSSHLLFVVGCQPTLRSPGIPDFPHLCRPAYTKPRLDGIHDGDSFTACDFGDVRLLASFSDRGNMH
jgi:hypothetical protein